MKLAVRSLVLASLLAAASAHAQSPAPAADQIAVGSKPYAVQASVAGAGRYTVIFESGFGTGMAWRAGCGGGPLVARQQDLFSLRRQARQARPGSASVVMRGMRRRA